MNQIMNQIMNQNHLEESMYRRPLTREEGHSLLVQYGNAGMEIKVSDNYHVGELDLPGFRVKILNYLFRIRRIVDVADLVEHHTKEELLDNAPSSSFGRKSLEDLEQALVILGYGLKSEERTNKQSFFPLPNHPEHLRIVFKGWPAYVRRATAEIEAAYQAAKHDAEMAPTKAEQMRMFAMAVTLHHALLLLTKTAGRHTMQDSGSISSAISVPSERVVLEPGQR